MGFKYLFSFCLCLSGFGLFAQGQVWQTYMDSVPSFSSPRSADLNGDGVLDIVLGGGIDGIAADNGIMAFNGVDGSVLWTKHTHDEMFVSANFQDITGDGIPDVYIGGRQAQFYALDGSTGQQIWQFYPYPYPVAPGDSGLWNFYSPQFIPDVSGDGLADLLVANGGDHSLPLWETNRPPGHLMILDAANGSILAKAVVPDSAETYCSPLVLDLKDDGVLWILFGTGGESIGGNFYAVPLSHLINQNITGATLLAAHPTRGFIAPAAAHKSLTHNGFDFIVQGFGGTVYKFNGQTLGQQWSTTIPGTESSAQPILGNFTGADLTPDVFAVFFKGNMTTYTDFYQVMIDGLTGSIQFKDSLGKLHYLSGNAVDLNNDGRDEAIASITYQESGYFQHKLMSFDFQNNTINQVHETKAGVNLGCTPLIVDIDNNDLLDLVYVVRKDSLNPVGLKGINVFRVELPSNVPNSGIAWGSYIGSNFDGTYSNLMVDCGSGSVVSSSIPTNPSCNGLADGSIQLVLDNPSLAHTYLWSNGTVNSSLQNVPAGNYTVVVVDSEGCSESVSITLNDPFVISSGGITAPTCPGGSNGNATVSSTGCPCMFNTCVFTWSTGTVGAYNAQLTSGQHTVTIAHPGGCVVTHTVTIPESAPIVVDSTMTDISCFGANDGSIELTGNPSYTVTYLWSTGEQTSNLSNLGPGNYNVVVTDNRPCTAELNFTISSPDSLLFSTDSSPVSCYGDTDGSISIMAEGGSPIYTYVVNGTDYTVAQFDDLTAGSYVISITDANNCTTGKQTVEIIEPENIEVAITTVAESAPGANNGSASLSIQGGTPGYSVFWNPPLSGSGLSQNALGNGTYNATITDANNCTRTVDFEIQTLSIEDGLNSLWSVYPNPAKDVIYISGESVLSAELFDLSGKLIIKEASNTMNVQHLASGSYILKIVGNHAVAEHQIFIIH